MNKMEVELHTPMFSTLMSMRSQTEPHTCYLCFHPSRNLFWIGALAQIEHNDLWIDANEIQGMDLFRRIHQPLGDP